MGGKTAIVTGANGGIGLETTKGLAKQGFHVVMACRDTARGHRAQAEVRSKVPDARTEVAQLDLAHPGSIHAFLDTVRDRHAHIDVLVNNAGLWNLSRRTSPEGVELTFAVNHLGTFRLTNALLPIIRRAPAPRIVTVASTAHHFAWPRLDDLQLERHRYEGSLQYCNTKLYNLWFNQELARRTAEDGIGCFAVHPGSGGTSLTRDMGDWTNKAIKAATKTPKMLAKSSLKAATSPRLAGRTGEYHFTYRKAHRSRRARDQASARRLWEITEEMA